jgi:hypothetical protein
MNDFLKYRSYIYLFFALFALGCKNDTTRHFDQQVEVTIDTLPNNQNKTSVRIVGMPGTEGVMTITDYVKEQSNFTPEFKLLTLPDSKFERLFIQYFTGGAHCCTNLQAYKFNTGVDAFEYLDEYSYDGDAAELEYPFKVNYSIEYFYTAYANGGFIDCSESNFARYLYLVNDKFEFRSTGNYNTMKNCLVNYLRSVDIPELNERSNTTDRTLMFDNGERETVLNFMLEMFTLNNDIDLIQDIYMNYFSNVTDKQVMWDEISLILLKNGKINPTEQLVNTLVKSRKDKNIAQGNWQSSSTIITTNTIINNTSDGLPSDCDELLELIQNEGDRIRYLDDSDMNSTALNNVSLYEYDGIYYVVIKFQDGNHEYIYCDIDLSYWNRFADNDEDSYGRGYQNWIRPYTSCGCGR